MKKLLIATLLFFTLIFSEANAQYVTISDTAMVSWLTTYYPSAMSGNQMDTTNSAITSALSISENGVDFSNLDGIQYFDNLYTLTIQFNGLESIIGFPPNLEYIDLLGNNLVALPALPSGLVYLNCSTGQINNLPSLPNSLTNLNCQGNNLTSLPNLPNNLQNLNCSFNNLTTLPTLPPFLQNFECHENSLTSLPSLTNNLQFINCASNNLTVLPNLPQSLLTLFCNINNLTSIPTLPSALQQLNCESNNLTNLPSLPSTMNQLICSYNNLTALPILPATITFLGCNNNSITNLPIVLPNSLTALECHYNNLTNLPDLPASLASLSCNNNSIASLPNLPQSLYYLICTQNNLNCLPILPDTLQYLFIDSTSITCLPNLPSNLLLIDVPGLSLCLPGNANGCVTTAFISGAVFNDSMNNCTNTGNMNTNTAFHLFDDQDNFLQSRSSSFDDNYYFSIQPGVYSIRIDSSFFTNSIGLSCPPSGEHLVTALLDSSYTDRDFGFQCIGVDLGITAIVQQGIVFPGQAHSVNPLIGDLSNYFGLNCAAGMGGTVELTVNGPITYLGFPGFALTPTVNGNTYSYTVSDFSSISIGAAFALNFLTDTTAQAGDSVTVTATITPNSVDLDSTNNSKTYVYSVVNSYDPNMKVVNPVNVLPGYDDYFTYTVHFQNLGTAPAFNIKIKDTLDSNLDFSTFRVIDASHNYSYNLSDDLLNVYFPNIMLADSASNSEGSKGYVHYQVKPKPNLPHGTTIENTAHIFFDFNPAVVTNTTINAFLEDLSVAEPSGQTLTIYPNPSTGDITLVNQQNGNEAVNIRIYDLLGKELHSESVNFTSGVAQLNLNENAGTYMLVVENEMGALSSSRLVIQK